MKKNDSNINWCNKCGACCRQLKEFGPLYNFLDAGEGICKYFDTSNNLCSIYPIRPIFCRISEMRAIYFTHVPEKEFWAANRVGCEYLRTKLGL